MFQFKSLLTDDLEANSVLISETLHQIRAIISGDAKLAKLVPLVIKDKGQNEIDRFKSLCEYVLDWSTLELIQEHQKKWLNDPSAFDTTLKSSQWTFLFQEVREKHPEYLPQIDRARAHLYGDIVIDSDTLKKTVADMVTAAGHYMNWKKELGVSGGLALVLGHKWAESSWTKLVGKSGSKFTAIAERLRQVGLPEVAERYACLEQRLIAYKVDAMLREAPVA